MTKEESISNSNLNVKIGKITLKNPVITASGTYGYGNDLQPSTEIAKLGAFCTKGLSLKPREGNPPPRICETRCGMLNAIGLANIGIEAFLKDVLPDLHRNGITVFVNIFGESEEEYRILAELLKGNDAISAIELNVSCPNVTKGGVLFGKKPKLAAKITEIVTSRVNLPVIVKLTPEAENIIEVAKAVIKAGACAVTAVNTFRAMAIDINTGYPKLSTIFGGFSGPAIKPIALRIVFEIYRELEIDIIGCGGIMNHEDAIEYIMAGAAAIQVGTANLLDPEKPFKILEGLKDYCAIKNIDLVKIKGMAHKIKNKNLHNKINR